MNSFFYVIFLFVLLVVEFKKFGAKTIQKYDFVIDKKKNNYTSFSESWKKNRSKIKQIAVKQKLKLFHLKCPTVVKQNFAVSYTDNKSSSCADKNNKNTDKKVQIAQWVKRNKKLTYFHITNIDKIKKFIKKKKNNKTLFQLLTNKKLIKRYLEEWKFHFLYSIRRTKIITKFFTTFSLIVTLLNICGLKPESIALHNKRIIRSFEFYRIITSALFFGDISLYVLTNIYMFYLESQKLEKSLGSSETLSFYFSQLFLLSVICCYLKKPFFSTALLKSLLFVNCMLQPNQESHIIFGINVYNIYLPYISILIDVLHAQKLNASLSGLLGVFGGSIYYLLNIYLYENYNIKVFRIPSLLKKIIDSLESEELFE